MYIIFDIGGTKMRLAASTDGKTFGEPIIQDTPPDFDKAISKIEEIIKELSVGDKIEAISGGIAGVLDKKGSSLFRSPNLEGWEGKPLAQELQRITDSSVFIKNDADMAGLGEAFWGAGKDYNIVTYFTISTGIGGTRIVNKKIDANHFGFEPGHQIITTFPPLLLSKGEGVPALSAEALAKVEGQSRVDWKHMHTLEELVGGASMEKQFNMHPSKITDEAIWDEKARTLAIGLHNMLVHWSPEVVVLGGAMMLKTPGIDIEKVKQYLKEIARQIRIFPEPPLLKLSTLGHLSGLYGALAYLVSRALTRA